MSKGVRGRRDATGALQFLALVVVVTSAVTMVNAPPGRAQHEPTAKTPPTALLHVINSFNSFSTYALMANGALPLLHPNKMPKAPHNSNDPLAVAATPDGHFVYVVDFVTSRISGYEVSTSGSLTLEGEEPIGGGQFPGSLISDAAGDMLMAVNFTNTDAFPTSYSINSATGKLTMLHSINIGNCTSAGGLVVTSGDVLYVACDSGSVIGMVALSFDGRGNFTKVNGSPFPAGTAPFAPIIDGNEKHLYVTDQDKNSIYGLDINPDGRLTAISGSPFASGAGPQSLAIAGNHLYSANNFDNTISGYTIDSGTGALRQLTGSPFATLVFPIVIVVDPSDKFLAIGNFPQAPHARSRIETVAIDQTTGALSNPIAGSTHSLKLLRNFIFAPLP